MSHRIRIAVVGAGLIGRRHAGIIRTLRETELSGVVDPAPDAKVFADAEETRHFSSIEDLLDAGDTDAVVIATPNQFHVAHGLACIEAGLPLLVEKPLADTVADGARLVDAARAAGVPLLVGHHRRHNPLVERARAAIEAGDIGSIVSVAGMAWLYKPDGYFDAEWRRKPGAGPVFINLIHDIDLMQHLCGRIDAVQALESAAARGLDVEDTAVVILRFASGALGTLNVSDTIVAPWSWELTARENSAYPATAQACYTIGGTHGSLELPGLRLWRNAAPRGWWEPIAATQLPHGLEDPLVRQIRHFADVVRSDAVPVVTGEDGLRALRVVEAIKLSAQSHRLVAVDHGG